MVKEFVFHFKSNLEAEKLIDKLEERIALKRVRKGVDIGRTFYADNRTLELHVLPKNNGESCEVNIKTREPRLEPVVKEVFGKPYKETNADASFLDVAEFIAEIPLELREQQIAELLKEKFNLSDEKITYFKKLILQQGKRENAREYLREAAQRLMKND